MIAWIVRFRSEMPDEQVKQTYEERAPRYRALPGLVNKYYLRYPDTGEHGAVYLWDSEDSLKAFSQSELASTIPTAYRVVGEPTKSMAEVMLVLRPEG